MKFLRNLFKKKQKIEVEIKQFCPNCLNSVIALAHITKARGVEFKKFDAMAASIALHDEKIGEFVKIVGIEIAQTLIIHHSENEDYELAKEIKTEIDKLKSAV